MAITISFSAGKIDITATDAGGNTIDDIYVATAAAGAPYNTYMTRAGASAPYTYSMLAETEIEISNNCYIKDYTAGGGMLQWNSRTANSTSTFDVASGGKLELGPDWTIDFSSGTYYTYVYGNGQLIFQGTDGHPVKLKHYYSFSVYALSESLPWDWDWVSCEDMNYGSSGWLSFAPSANYYRVAHSFKNVTFSNPGGSPYTGRGTIIFSGCGDWSTVELDNITIDGTSGGFSSSGSSFKVTNSTIKNTTSSPLSFQGGGASVMRYKIGSEATYNVNCDQQAKVTFDTCTFNDNYTANEYTAGLMYGGVVKFKNCTLDELGSPPAAYGFMAYSQACCLYEGTQTLTNVTSKYYHGAGGGGHFDCKTLTLNVTDSGGSPIDGATVTITEESGRHTETLRTRSTGYIKDLFGDNPVLPYREITDNAGTTFTTWDTYTITVSKDGYELDERTGIDMSSDQSITVALTTLTAGNTRIYGSSVYGSTIY